jgi:transposase
MRGYARFLHITPSAEERAALDALVADGSAAEARRARAILMRSHGATYDEVRRETGLTVDTILTWVHRFLIGGVRSLRDRRYTLSLRNERPAHMSSDT